MMKQTKQANIPQIRQ